MRLLLVLLALVLPGCAGPPSGQPACGGAKAKVVSYYTPVRAATPSIIGSGLVEGYRSQATVSRVTPCSSLLLRQELILLRAPAATAVLQEVREFYAQGTLLVARQRQDVTEQLRTPGMYRNAIALPIPAKAPPGRYRVVSRLQLEHAGARPAILGESEVSFEIVNGE